MRPRVRHESALSVERAFVVHLAAGTRGGAPFSSLEGLLAFFAAVLDVAALTPIRNGENR